MKTGGGKGGAGGGGGGAGGAGGGGFAVEVGTGVLFGLCLESPFSMSCISLM